MDQHELVKRKKEKKSNTGKDPQTKEQTIPFLTDKKTQINKRPYNASSSTSDTVRCQNDSTKKC